MIHPNFYSRYRRRKEIRMDEIVESEAYKALEAELAEARKENEGLKADLESGFMQGTYARLKNLQNAETELAEVRKEIELIRQRLGLFNADAELTYEYLDRILTSYRTEVADLRRQLEEYKKIGDCLSQGLLDAGKEKDSLRRQLAEKDAALHASAPEGYKCSDCTIDKEPCPTCYAAWWRKRHPYVLLIEPTPIAHLEDELAEARADIDALKFQLKGYSARLAEKDTTMRKLWEALTPEKRHELNLEAK